jgi:hypothetical protein
VVALVLASTVTLTAEDADERADGDDINTK